MGDTWTSSTRFDPERVGAVAIYCSDGRYNEQFDEFLHQQLGLPRYDRLTLPGGPAALAGHFLAYRDEEALADQLRFLIEAHRLERAVLIAHAGCGFYLKKLGVSESSLRTRQVEDLLKAAERIEGLSRKVRAECYLASPVEQGVRIESVGR